MVSRTQSISGWEYRTIDSLVELSDSGVWGDENSDGIGVLRSTNFTNSGRLDLQDVAFRDIESKKLAKKLLKCEDILLERSGGGPKQPVGRVIYFDSDGEYVCGNFIQRLRANPDILSKFLFYQLFWMHQSGKTEQLQQQTTGIRNLNFKDYMGTQLPVPPLSEQRKVAVILTSIDDAIVSTQRIINQSKVVKRGLLQQLMTQGVGHSMFTKTEVGEIPIEWEVVPLSNVLNLVERPMKMENETEYQLVTVKRRHGGVVPRERLLGKEIVVKSQFYIREGDFLISKRQIVHGACEVVPKALDGAIVSNEYHTLLVDSNLDMDYFRWFCRTPIMMKYFLVSSIGVHIEKMLFKLDDWLKRKIALPPLEEQKEIARVLTSVERSIESNQEYLERLTFLKSGLMQVLLTGEVRVNVDESSEVSV